VVERYFGESINPLEPDVDWDIEELLERSQEREQTRIEAELQQIDLLLEKRKEIHEESVEEVESKLEWYVDRLQQEYRLKADREKISELKAQIRSFYSELRDLEREKWLDIQELERERRQLERELEELSDQELMSELMDL
jgi:chromosome segregation ATPase